MTESNAKAVVTRGAATVGGNVHTISGKENSSVRRYFYMLSQLGLIEIAGGAPSKSGFRKRLYRVVAFKAAKGMRKKDVQEEMDRILRAWHHPQMELYPGTALGSSGYSAYKKKRKHVPSGRNPEYT